AKSGSAMRWVPPTNFSFIKQLPLLPVQAIESGFIASTMPLAFCKEPSSTSGWTLVAVCGNEAHSNKWVDDQGRWTAPVMPGSVRWLPFGLKEVGKGKALAAIDPKYAGAVLSSDAGAVPLYSSDGDLHSLARKRLDLLVAQQPNWKRT